MPLEDFFTLGEMRDGLSSLSRVEKLVNVIQKQKNCVSSTTDDGARQWSAVAGTLAATENKDCLAHFIQLNGLCFLNEWLQEAQKHANDMKAKAIEELINALLTTLERLQIDEEKFTACGLGITVEQLLGHENIKIKERAGLLFDKWNKLMFVEASMKDQEKSMTCIGGPNNQLSPSTDSNTSEKGLCSATAPCISPCRGSMGERIYEAESTGIESQQSIVARFNKSSQQRTLDCEDISKSNQLVPITSSTSVAGVGQRSLLGPSFVSNSCPENLSVTEESSVCPATESASAGTCSSTGKTKDDQLHVLMFTAVNGSMADMDAEVNKMDTSLDSCFEKQSSGLSATTSVTATESQPCKIDSTATESCTSDTAELQADTGVGDHKEPMYLKIDSFKTSSVRVEGASAGDSKNYSNDANLSLGRRLNLVIATDSCEIETNVVGELDQGSVMELEYEEIDALEVARQVAIEVEREVVDYREPFCRSPEAHSGETVVNSPVPAQGKQDQPLTEDANKLPTESDASDSAICPQKDCTRITEDKPGEHGLPSVTQESGVGKSDKSRVIIDLNEDIYIDTFDCTFNPSSAVPVNVSTPVAVIGTSRRPPGFPVTHLHFEGELGWRGSAATSAFRPASARRTLDSDKSSSNSKQKPNFLRFDLNVTESEVVVEVDPTEARQMPVSSGILSSEPAGISLSRTERLHLDLNRLGDDDPSVCPSSNWRIPYQQGDQSLSYALSSCSKQSSMRDIDLNDNPSSFDASDPYEINKAPCVCESSKLNDPLVMAMNLRQEYSRQSFLSRRLSGEPSMPMMSYPHMMHAPYGYNGFIAGRPMPMPLPPYGPTANLPYQVVDSQSFTSTRPHFLVSASGQPLSINGMSPFQPGFDLNSGLTTTFEMGRREGGNLSLFRQGRGDVIKDQVRTSSRSSPSNSGMPLKRKELECSQDSYPLGYKQVKSWRQ